MTDESQTRTDDQQRSFVAIFARDQRRVYAYICTMLPHSVDAEEVMQETALIMWSKWSQFVPGSDFVRWGCGIARLEVFRFLRERRRHGGIVLSEDIIDLVSTEFEHHQDNESERRAALLACLGELSEEQRQLLSQRYGQQVTARELADQLNRPTRSVYKSLKRAREQTRDCVRRRLAVEERS
jgi:RNA polymerase sigma-70 factor (ECF subfamily)